VPYDGHFTVAGGAQLYLRPTPTTAAVGAEPAVYVHGLAGASTNWTDFAAALAPWLDGTAIDLPGYGRSGPAPGFDYSIAAFARVVIGYLDQRDAGPVHLFGNSMGGSISIRVAAERPDLVRTLTLISPAVPDLRLRRPGTDAGLAPLLFLPGIDALLRRRLGALAAEERVRGIIDVCFAHPDRVPPNRLAEAVAAAAEREHTRWAMDAFSESTRGLVRFYLGAGRRSAWRLMQRIQAPTLVVWGTADKLVDVALAPRVARTIPNARLLVLPDTGHVAQIEEPLITARAFLALRADTSAAATLPDTAGDQRFGGPATTSADVGT
jgi:pimeloyl-ACP methyl ester carboxylesterase